VQKDTKNRPKRAHSSPHDKSENKESTHDTNTDHRITMTPDIFVFKLCTALMFKIVAKKLEKMVNSKILRTSWNIEDQATIVKALAEYVVKKICIHTYTYKYMYIHTHRPNKHAEQQPPFNGLCSRQPA